MAQRRITELTEATTLKNDMYVPVDHGTDGTQRVSIGTLIDDTLSVPIAAAGAKSTGDAIDDLKTNINKSIRFNSLEPYLYKKNTYIDANLAEASASDGYDLYKIPFKEGDFFRVSWESSSTYPWGAYSDRYFVTWQNTSDEFSRTLDTNHYRMNAAQKETAFIAPAECAYLYLLVKRTQLSETTININYPYSYFAKDDYKRNFIVPVKDGNAVYSQCYLNVGHQMVYPLNNADYSCWWIPVKAGDKVKIKVTTMPG